MKDNIETLNALASSPALTPHNTRYKNIGKPEGVVKYWPAHKVCSKLMFISKQSILYYRKTVIVEWIMGFHSQSESTKQKLWMLLSTSLFCSCDKKLRLSPMSPVDICSWMVTFLFLLDNTIKNHFLICKVNSIDEVLNCYCLYRDMAFISSSFMPSWYLGEKNLISFLRTLCCLCLYSAPWC